MANAQIARKLGASQIEIAISEPQIFVADFGIDGKGQIVRSIQNAQLVRNDFNVARWQFGIFCSRYARGDRACDLNHIFAAKRMRLLRDFDIFFRSKNNLG